MKGRAGIILGLSALFLGTVLIAGAVAFRLTLDAPQGAAAEGKVVVIPRGANSTRVALILEEEGVIDDAGRFSLWVDLLGLENVLRYGEYRFEGGGSLRDVIATLTRGKTMLHRLTIPEGFNLSQTARRVESAGLGSEAEFLAAATRPGLPARLGIPGETMEGFCFPDTYFIPGGWPADRILETMAARFGEVFTPEMKKRVRERGMTLLEVVTLASIIEKETGDPGEQPRISAVFHNRLARKIPLMADPAVIYGIADFDGNLTKEHLKTPGPYNLYLKRGLPPGPIANPGLGAMTAALYPADADHLYFVSRNDGTHHFSRTLQEHNQAVRQYQKGGR